MLSKPLAESSGGRSVVTSISRSSRSRMTLAYSVRFRRWRTTDPGLTRAGRFAIDFRFQPSPGAPRTRPAAAASRPAAASRRREACARLFPTTPGDRRRWRDPPSRATGSPFSCDRCGRSRNTDREARAVSRPMPRGVLTRDGPWTERRCRAAAGRAPAGRGARRLAVDRGGGDDATCEERAPDPPRRGRPILMWSPEKATGRTRRGGPRPTDTGQRVS